MSEERRSRRAGAAGSRSLHAAGGGTRQVRVLAGHRYGGEGARTSRIAETQAEYVESANGRCIRAIRVGARGPARGAGPRAPRHAGGGRRTAGRRCLHRVPRAAAGREGLAATPVRTHARRLSPERTGRATRATCRAHRSRTGNGARRRAGAGAGGIGHGAHQHHRYACCTGWCCRRCAICRRSHPLLAFEIDREPRTREPHQARRGHRVAWSGAHKPGHRHRYLAGHAVRPRLGRERPAQVRRHRLGGGAAVRKRFTSSRAMAVAGCSVH